MAGAQETRPSTPSLLGIPPELRSIIYAHVLQLDLAIAPINGFWLERRAAGYPNGIAGCQLQIHELRRGDRLGQPIPWVSLSQSCKLIARELEDHMTSRRYLDANENQQWTLDLGPDESPSCSSVARISWTKLPCLPHRARKLKIIVNGTARAMMAALKLAIERGFRMDRNHPFPLAEGVDLLHVHVLSSRSLVFPEHRYNFEPIDEAALRKAEFETVFNALNMYMQAPRSMVRFRKVVVSNNHGQHKTLRLGA